MEYNSYNKSNYGSYNNNSYNATKKAATPGMRDESKINVIEEKKQFTKEQLAKIGAEQSHSTAYRLSIARAFAAMSNLFAGATQKTAMGWGYVKHGSFSSEIAYVFSLLGLMTDLRVGRTEATARVFSVYNKEDAIEFSLTFDISPEILSSFTEKITYDAQGREIKSKGSMNIMQAYGAVTTYYRRYLWFMILEMADCDALDDVSVEKQIEENKK